MHGNGLRSTHCSEFPDLNYAEPPTSLELMIIDYLNLAMNRN